MDKIRKFLCKLTSKEQIVIYDILQSILNNDFWHLDITKLVNNENKYRVRKGNIRIVFSKSSDGNKIINIDYRWAIYK